MKKLLYYLLFMIFALPTYCPADDNGTDEDGRVIWSETLTNRCNLNSKKSNMDDCIKKLASDYHFNKTPEGNNYTSEVVQILHEQTSGYLTIALQRLVENGNYHDDSYNEQGEGAAGLDPAKDTRDVLERIGKSTQRNSEVLHHALDSQELKSLSSKYETLYFQIVPQTAQIMGQEAEDPDLRKDKFRQ
ncbi:MAG: hypothetical protein MJ210_00470 [Alphaproteobacteria bacterium]|nr:hypothetical protein [Alphaproteobacteria bacterium]